MAGGRSDVFANVVTSREAFLPQEEGEMTFSKQGLSTSLLAMIETTRSPQSLPKTKAVEGWICPSGPAPYLKVRAMLRWSPAARGGAE